MLKSTSFLLKSSCYKSLAQMRFSFIASNAFVRFFGMNQRFLCRSYHISTKLYAKKREKETSANETVALPDVKAFDASMDQRIFRLVEEFDKLRSGGSNNNSELLNHITVVGTNNKKIKLQDAGQITLRNQSTLAITLFDPSLISSAVTAIIKGVVDLNLNPVVEGNVILVSIPKASKESRDLLVKTATKAAEKVER